jgi:hypothetical protein
VKLKMMFAAKPLHGRRLGIVGMMHFGGFAAYPARFRDDAPTPLVNPGIGPRTVLEPLFGG